MSEARYLVAVDETPGGYKPKRGGRWYVMRIQARKRPIYGTTVDFTEDITQARQYSNVVVAVAVANWVHGYTVEIVAQGGRA